MRNLFPGRYKPSEAQLEKLMKEAEISFDTNLILNLYSYSEEARKEWFEVMDKISGRIWITYQVAKEYQGNRVSRISAEEAKYDSMEQVVASLNNDFSSKLDQTWRFAPTEVENWKKRVDEVVKEISKKLVVYKEKHPKLLEQDNVREKLDVLFEGKIGFPHDQSFISEAEKEAEHRYKNKVPPGFQDAKKELNKYGDYFIWKELLTHSKDKKKPLILVTEDRKSDWWEEYKGKTLGPHPELINEFKKQTGQDFYLYNADQFLEHAKKFLAAKVADTTIAEAKAIELADYNRSTVRSWWEQNQKEERERMLTTINSFLRPDNMTSSHILPNYSHMNVIENLSKSYVSSAMDTIIAAETERNRNLMTVLQNMSESVIKSSLLEQEKNEDTKPKKSDK